jgi:uridine kinase
MIIDLERILSESIDYIVLDYPFAYKHIKMSKLFDFAVFIDTPLDIAMARKVMKDFQNNSVAEIMSDMGIRQGRRGYLEMLNAIKPNSDLIIVE